MLKQLTIALALITFLSCGQNAPLTDYEHRTAQEQALKTILLEFQDGVNSKNSDKIMNLLSEDASIMVGRERKILSKKEYAEILPDRLAENSPISLGKPKMTVSGDKAEVRIYVTRGDSNFLVVYDLQFENDKWRIHGWSY